MKRKSKKNVNHHIQIIVERHKDYFVAYPLGIKGACVGEGDTYDEALKDVQGAIRAHIAAFGEDVIEDLDSPVTQVYMAETEVCIEHG